MVEIANKLTRIVKLYAYQLALFLDTARVVVAVWCRQAGKDFTTACKAVSHALETGQDWYIVSITQRQADATFAKCQRVGKLYREILKLKAQITMEQREYVEYDRLLNESFRCTARTLRLPGGGSVTALPGRDPDTLAGLTGNVIFTEFGLFPNGGYDHWRVVFPLTTRGYQVIIISTPRGKNTKLHELVSSPGTYSVHLVDIHRAVAEGMPITDNQGRPTTVEALHAIYGDEAGWQREYLCQFTGDLEALIKWTQLLAAGAAGAQYPFDWLRVEAEAGWISGYFRGLASEPGRAEFGWDVARRGDLSALWVNVDPGAGLPRYLRHLVLMHNVSFALQREIVQEAMDARPDSVGAGDATGLGMDSNETLTARYGDRWRGVTFTAAGKREIGSLLRTAFDDGDQVLPPADGPAGAKFVHADLYAVQREGDTDTLRLTETENPLLPESHCDIAYACGLARKAAGILAAQPYLSMG